jgi:pilus assembly protein Flp/PilA
MYAFFKQLIQDEAGVTAIEYGLIAALVAIAAIAAMTSLGTSLTSTFSHVAATL